MKTCNKCGSTDLYKSGHCKPCKKSYAEKYRSENPDKARAAAISAHRKYGHKYNLQKASRYAENPEPAKLRAMKYRAEFPEKAAQIKSAWYESNRDSIAVRAAAHYRANKPLWRVYSQNRRARERSAGGSISRGLSERLFVIQKGKCACCGHPLGDDFHLDHIMPLALGGTNTDDNMQLLTATCNLKKGAKHPVEFMQQRGFLL